MLKNLKGIEDETYILELFRYLKSQESVPVSLCVEGHFFFTQIKVSDGENSQEYIIECSLPDSGASIKPKDSIEIKLFYQDAFAKFESFVIRSIEVNKFIIQKPGSIFSSFNRGATRYNFKNDEKVVVFFPDIEKELKLLDLSTKGMSFVGEKNLLKKAQLLKNNVLKLENGEEACFDAIVKNIRGSKEENDFKIYGLELMDMDWKEYKTLYFYLFGKTCSDVTDVNDFLFIKYISSL